MKLADYLESVRLDVCDLHKVEDRLQTLSMSCGGRPGTSDGVGGNGTHVAKSGDGLADAILSLELRAERMRAQLAPRLRLARAILYGRDRRGGMAKRRSQLDADILHEHYLCDRTWRDIAGELDREGTRLPNGRWCWSRARRACQWADTFGVHKLVG